MLLCFCAKEKLRRDGIYGGVARVRRGDFGAGAWMRSFVAEGAPQDDGLSVLYFFFANDCGLAA
jgi:hypothetical protein